MSYATVVTIIAALDAFIVAALAYVCCIPFRLDRHPERVQQPEFSLDLEPDRDPGLVPSLAG